MKIPARSNSKVTRRRHIVFAANATAPSVLLLNDKYDPNWHVTVDGKPAELLRCNFIMRGVYLHARRAHGRIPIQPAEQAALRHAVGHHHRIVVERLFIAQRSVLREKRNCLIFNLNFKELAKCKNASAQRRFSF